MAHLASKAKVIVDQEGQSTLGALHIVFHQQIVSVSVRRYIGHSHHSVVVHICSEALRVMMEYLVFYCKCFHTERMCNYCKEMKECPQTPSPSMGLVWKQNIATHEKLLR